MGYLGGIGWAILVANICKDNPFMEPNQLLNRFFEYYRDYEWGADNPITLCEIANDPNKVRFDIDNELIYKPDPKALMPIITPAFPSMNSTYNVSHSTLSVMLLEFEKAAMITSELNKNKGNSQITWKRLFKKFPFFRAYEHFIEIHVLSKNEDDHKKWLGFAETKVKKLLKNLEMFDRKIGECLEFRPWPKSTTLRNDDFPFNDVFYIGMRVKGGCLPKKELIDLTETRRIFYDKFWESIRDTNE